MNNKGTASCPTLTNNKVCNAFRKQNRMERFTIFVRDKNLINKT